MEQRKFQRFADNSHVAFSGETVKGAGRLDNLSLSAAQPSSVTWPSHAVNTSP